MSRASLLLVLLLSWALLPLASYPASAEDDAAPQATHVVVRGRTSLTGALEAAVWPAMSDETAPRPVGLVLDVTPNTQAARPALLAALRRLDEVGGAVPSWHIARLGEPFKDPASAATGLGVHVNRVLGHETDVANTLAALEETLESFPERGGVVVYLADWRFEDDHDLEGFVKALKRRGMTLSIVGSEAAAGRGWNDGIREQDALSRDIRGGLGIERHWEMIGRDPFGRGEPEAPWHGGDTSYPHAPYRWQTSFWRTTFRDHDFDFADDGGFRFGGGHRPKDPEDLLRRLPGGFPGLGEDPDDVPGPGVPENPAPDPHAPDPAPEIGVEMATNSDVLHPLPSGFGSYALMRVAGLTGGRYVLFSFNPSGRRRVRYDYARCDLFPPDLRSRKDILGDLRGNPHARAMMEIWARLADDAPRALEHMPPLKSNLRTPRGVDHLDESWELMWSTRSAWRSFVKDVRRDRKLIGWAIDRLDDVLKDSPEADFEAPARRLAADARLLRHVLHVHDFELGEALAAASSIHPEAWASPDIHMGLVAQPWIARGRDPENIRTWHRSPYDPEAGEAVRVARAAMLERYRGTPIGEQVALNEVNTFRPTVWRVMTGVPSTSGRSPAESTGPGPTTPTAPGTGSGGGGPATGR